MPGGLHEEIRNFDSFEKSTRRFTNFTKRIGGGTDIDCFIERHGKFMFFEGKPLIENDSLIRMAWGQYTAFLRLALSSDKNKVYIIGEAPDGEPKKIGNILYTNGTKHYHDEETKKWVVDMPLNLFRDIDIPKLEMFVYMSYKMFELDKYDRDAWSIHEASSLL